MTVITECATIRTDRTSVAVLMVTPEMASTVQVCNLPESCSFEFQISLTLSLPLSRLLMFMPVLAYRELQTLPYLYDSVVNPAPCHL